MTQASDIGATPNQSRTLYRTAINNCFQAVVTRHAGPAAPSTIYANMEWWDTTSGLVKLRNPTNTAWATVATIGPPFTWDNTTLVQSTGVIESATMSGSAVDITSLPAGMTAFDLILIGVTLSGVSSVALLLGSSAGVVTTGYASTGENIGASGAFTSGGVWLGIQGLSGNNLIGHFCATGTSGNRWTVHGISTSINQPNDNTIAAGTVVLPGVLDRIRLIPTAGTFTAGAYQIRWYR